MPSLGSASMVRGLTERKEEEESKEILDDSGELLAEEKKPVDQNEITNEYLMNHKEPLTPQLRVLLFFVAFGSIMMGMDQSLLTTAEIFAKPFLNISSSHWSWVASAFSLATAWGTLL
jgi:hypothetical protein